MVEEGVGVFETEVLGSLTITISIVGASSETLVVGGAEAGNKEKYF